MDTQRLILFVVFSFSALLLWEAWQKEFRPPPPVAATSPAKSTAPADLPSAPTAAPAATTPAQAQPGVPAPPGPDKEPAAAGIAVQIGPDEVPQVGIRHKVIRSLAETGRGSFVIQVTPPAHLKATETQ